MNGLGNKAQAIAVFISTLCLALGTAGATIPDFFPADIKYQLSIFFWFCAIIGFALKEALGSAYPPIEVEPKD